MRSPRVRRSSSWPELVTSGYVLESAEEARTLAQPADGPALSDWAAEAARAGAVVVYRRRRPAAGALFEHAGCE